MQHISFLLSKFQNVSIKDDDIKTAVRKTLQKFFTNEIKTTEIEVRNGSVFISGSPALKSEIFLRKNEILLAIKETLGTEARIVGSVR